MRNTVLGRYREKHSAIKEALDEFFKSPYLISSFDNPEIVKMVLLSLGTNLLIKDLTNEDEHFGILIAIMAIDMMVEIHNKKAI